ncbi:RecB-like helicase [Campylobacter sp. RM9328]|uniref:RecB-like helicase n=1 Tax=Campylobacter sp. RM9328 TaxID=1705720 RepID=UPI001474E8B8|nr:RecB-like helicase [Campylobacter sp. RM9328]
MHILRLQDILSGANIMIEPFLALQASAGSGKTFALSVRYIALLLSGASAKSITALTFTKKAASEMSERIVSTFLNLHKDEKSAELSVLCDMLEMSKDEVLSRRDLVSDEFLQSNLKITTFDAFFGMILRSFSLNLGLSPDFETKSEMSNLAQAQFIKNVAKNENLLTSLAIYIVLSSKSQTNFFETLQMFYENFDSVKTSGFVDFNAQNEALDIMSELKEIAVKRGGSQTAIKSFSVNSVEEIYEKSFLSRESLKYQVYSKIYDEAMDEKFVSLKEALKRHAAHLENFKLTELNGFLSAYKEALLQANAKLNMLTFTDITKLTHRLLNFNFDKDMLYFRLDERITHLLIDEFQDTNVMQYEIIYPLISEIVAGYGQNGLGSFFYVGDVKQSIYRFRGGKKELFGKILSDFSQVKEEKLNTNYRSAKNLVEFINETFKDKIQNYTAQIPHSSEGGYIKVVQSDEIQDTCVSEVEVLLKSGAKSEDITVLCWKNDDIRSICEALEQKGIASKDEGAMLLKNSPLVFAFINYVKFCLFGDEIYRYGAESFLGKNLIKLTVDFSKTAQQSLIYLAKKSAINMQNLDILKLIHLSAKSKNLINFIFEFENSDALSAQNSTNGVRVMTVHKSKGLEFEHVVLCDKTGKGRSESGNFICEYDVKNGYEIMLKLKNREYLDEKYAKIKLYSNELEEEEEINKLYVAMTRAKSSLVIIKKIGANGTNPSYFGAYTSNSKEVCYLDIPVQEIGKIKIKSKQISSEDKIVKKIELLSVAKEKTQAKTDDDEKNLHAIYFGLALHFLLEMSAKFNEDSIDKADILMRNKFSKFLSEDDLKDIKNRALMLIKNEKFKSAILDGELKKEQALSYKDELKQIDLLCFKANEILIIDYKSSKFSVEKNISQVQEYIQILSEIYPRKPVRGMLVYLLNDKIDILEI